VKAITMSTYDSQCESSLAAALCESGSPVPDVLAEAGASRFSVYRNNIAVRLVEVMEARFQAVRSAVGTEFFAAAARIFIKQYPPRTRILAFYGEEFPEFLRSFPPAAEIPYLPDLAQIDVFCTQAAYAADVDCLLGETLTQLSPEMLVEMRVWLHPSVAIVQSRYPIATIWSMNAGVLPAAAIDDWSPEDVVIARPDTEVEVRRLPPGGADFLGALARGEGFSEAASAAINASADFDLGFALASLFNFGLVCKLSPGCLKDT
jgi:hypothetical protein